MSTREKGGAFRWWLAAALALSASLVGAADQTTRGESMRQELAHGVLGLRWGMSAEQVMKAFPNAKKRGRPGRPLIAVNVAAGLWGARPKEDLFLLSVGVDDGFTEAHFFVPTESVSNFVTTVTEGLGEARTLTAKDFGTYTQVYEWSTPSYGISIRYATKEESPLQPGAAAQVSVKRGPITESFIDEYQRLTSKPAGQ